MPDTPAGVSAQSDRLGAPAGRVGCLQFGFLDYKPLQNCYLRAVRLGHDRGGIDDPRVPGGDALHAGAIRMPDLDPAAVLRGIRLAMSREDLPERPTDFRITNASSGRDLCRVDGGPAGVLSE